MELILYIIIRGLAIGILVSAPMGPIGVLCIQRTLNKGRWSGFFTGVGAALSDMLYCILTGLGMSIAIEFIETNKNILQAVGSVALLIYAIYLLRKNPAGSLKASQPKKVSYHQDFITGFLLTFSNPLILFLIISFFARFNFLLPEYHFYHYLIGFSFIFIGALFWWFIITYFVNKVRTHFNVRSMWLVNRIIGIIILIMSIFGLVTGVKDYLTAII